MPLDAHYPATRWFAAHELRTPLQAIQGGVALLLEERGAGLSPLQLEALGLIAAGTADLERCIGHLAELAALDAAPGEAPEAVTLGTLFGGAAPAPALRSTPALAAAGDLVVQVVRPPAARALELLSGLDPANGAAGGLVTAIESITDEAIVVGLAIAPAASGEGAVVWQLAVALLERAGVGLTAGAGLTTRLTLQRAAGIPISC